MTQEAFLDQPPESQELTRYDREHMKLYIRLLDAAADGADWHEAVSILFGLDADFEPERARHVYDTHLARARWMTEHGYRKLVREGRH
ncbi:DUF2285 domain-containing protein [Mesorhizobium sp. M1088]|uniref:DNA -binding domain-containing protein n=1 Tax=Mesorhizobium sp. M1088 TaxID=2957056 RepID=UPI0033361F96